jgi:D-sedoheptulose 7-phosphate isomerase
MKFGEIFDAHAFDLRVALESVDKAEVELLINNLKLAKKLGCKVFTIGNGGSAATAAHFANDLVSMGISARALTDSATITCIANDFSFREIFSRQLAVHAAKVDVVVAFSASGNSLNLRNAVKFSGHFHAMLGFDGGKLRLNKSVHSVLVPTALGAYGVAEDAHLALCHIIIKSLST